jgi:hypothetical protein
MVQRFSEAGGNNSKRTFEGLYRKFKLINAPTKGDISELWDNKEMLFSYNLSTLSNHQFWSSTLLQTISSNKNTSNEMLREIGARANLSNIFSLDVLSSVVQNPNAENDTISIVFAKCESNMLGTISYEIMRAIATNPKTDVSILEAMITKILKLDGVYDEKNNSIYEADKSLEEINSIDTGPKAMPNEYSMLIKNSLRRSAKEEKSMAKSDLEKALDLVMAAVSNPNISESAIEGVMFFAVLSSKREDSTLNNLFLQLIVNPKVSIENLEFMSKAELSPVIKLIVNEELKNRWKNSI